MVELTVQPTQNDRRCVVSGQHRQRPEESPGIDECKSADGSIHSVRELSISCRICCSTVRQEQERRARSSHSLDSSSGELVHPRISIVCSPAHLCSPDLFRSRVLELNASDERGISVVREKIKTFARETPRHAGVSSSVPFPFISSWRNSALTYIRDGKTYPCPPYKLIILDEADSMTQDAQSALRRIMETYSRITRFCLVCNYVTRSVSPSYTCSQIASPPSMADWDSGSSSHSLLVVPNSGSDR